MDRAPGQPPRAKLHVGALIALAALKVGIWAVSPAYGLAGAYRAEPTPIPAPTLSRAPDAVRVDQTLDLRGDAFPSDFFNDIRRFNFYTPNDPKRDLLPFSVVWSGQLVVPPVAATR